MRVDVRFVDRSRATSADRCQSMIGQREREREREQAKDGGVNYEISKSNPFMESHLKVAG